MSSKVLHGSKLFSCSKVRDSLTPPLTHQVWFSSFDKSYQKNHFSISPSSSSSSSSSTSSSTPSPTSSLPIVSVTLRDAEPVLKFYPRISDENNNDDDDNNNDKSIKNNNSYDCDIRTTTNNNVNTIDISHDMVTSFVDSNDKQQDAVESFSKPKSRHTNKNNNDNKVYDEKSRRTHPKQHLYCNPFLEDDGSEHGFKNKNNDDDRPHISTIRIGCRWKGLNQFGSTLQKTCEESKESLIITNNINNNIIDHSEDMIEINKSHAGNNNNDKKEDDHDDDDDDVKLSTNIRNDSKSLYDDQSDAPKPFTNPTNNSSNNNKFVSRSVSNDSMRKTKKSKDKIDKIIKQGARNYPAYLKLIYTGDSEHSSDDDVIATTTMTDYKPKQKQQQEQHNSNHNKTLSTDDLMIQSSTLLGIYDRISLFIDDDDDDDDGGGILKIEKEHLNRQPDFNEMGKAGEGKNAPAQGRRAGANDDVTMMNGGCTDFPQGSETVLIEVLENNDLEDNDDNNNCHHHDDDDDDNDDDDDDDGCRGNEDDASYVTVECPKRNQTFHRAGGGDDDDDDDDEEDDDDDDEDEVLLKKQRSTSLQMMKNGKFIDGRKKIRHGGGDVDDDDDDDDNEELNRTDAFDKGRHSPHGNLTIMKRETEWMIELFRLEDDITSLKSVLDTKIRLAKEIKSRCFYDVRGRGYWKKKMKNFRIADTIRKTNEVLKSFSIFACAKIHGQSRYMETNQEPENEIFKVSGHNFGYE